MPSPYEIVLGDDVARLHPRLGTYFGEIPAGSVGRGQGVFDSVGTPSIVLTVPVIGRIYEYSGYFSYGIEPSIEGEAA